jgi:hypothetical protein
MPYGSTRNTEKAEADVGILPTSISAIGGAFPQRVGTRLAAEFNAAYDSFPKPAVSSLL